jgi:hypothetical protein
LEQNAELTRSAVKDRFWISEKFEVYRTEEGWRMRNERRGRLITGSSFHTFSSFRELTSVFGCRARVKIGTPPDLSMLPSGDGKGMTLIRPQPVWEVEDRGGVLQQL